MKAHRTILVTGATIVGVCGVLAVHVVATLHTSESAFARHQDITACGPHCSRVVAGLVKYLHGPLDGALIAITLGLLLAPAWLFHRSFRRLAYRWWYRHIYLRSRHWARFKLAWWSSHQGTAPCFVCNQVAKQHYADLHHLSYANIGHERFSDVAAIHRHCHISTHGH